MIIVYPNHWIWGKRTEYWIDRDCLCNLNRYSNVIQYDSTNGQTKEQIISANSELVFATMVIPWAVIISLLTNDSNTWENTTASLRLSLRTYYFLINSIKNADLILRASKDTPFSLDASYPKEDKATKTIASKK